MNTTTKAHIRSQRNISIDVGKTFLDIHILELDRHWQVHNTLDDIKGLVKTLKRFVITRVIVEATGGYERKVVETRAAADIPVVVIQPMNIRQFAKAQGVLAKTDKIDASIKEKVPDLFNVLSNLVQAPGLCFYTERSFEGGKHVIDI